MTEPKLVPLRGFEEYPPEQMLERASGFHAHLARRRTVRHFAERPVSREVIEQCLLAAGTAPSGAHQQPWHFVAVADPVVKARIRAAAEAEEREFYSHRAPEQWLEALRPLGTDAHKPFLEAAPWLIAVFLRKYVHGPDGTRIKHYYTDESVGIATGLLIAAVHACGLASLTHTPSPMGFLNDILDRPRAAERAFLLLVVGYPAADAKVPDLARKPLQEIATFLPP